MMPRYIDAEDFIKRMSGAYEEDMWDVLEETPTANVVEVVRCKDCIHRPYVIPAKYDISGKCVKYSYVTAPDDVCPYLCDDSWYNRVPEDTFFCAKGERNYERNEKE